MHTPVRLLACHKVDHAKPDQMPVGFTNYRQAFLQLTKKTHIIPFSLIFFLSFFVLFGETS
jgi:hypothetical protein